MVNTPKGLRLHIGIFGRRNVGKSSILNALVGQKVAIVSDVAGTTTDPVEKVMELKPIGPVVFIDTAGVDDVGSLGKARIEKTLKAVERTELAVLVTDDWTDYEQRLIALFAEKEIPCVVAANKADLRTGDDVEKAAAAAGVKPAAATDAVKGTGIDRLRNLIIEVTPPGFLEDAPIIADMVMPGDTVILVTPLDIEAPKGRLKMLQVHCIREILDKGAAAIIVRETELASSLERLTQIPNLIICDSQVFDAVVRAAPQQAKMTTFSILMARFKGNLPAMVRATDAIAELVPGDRVLIAEACTHHPIGEDIGRVQIPRLLARQAGGELNIDVCAGRDFPADLTEYKLIIHCGACVFNRMEMRSRIAAAASAGVPITNYGLAISWCLGLLERALEPFADVRRPLRPKAGTRQQ